MLYCSCRQSIKSRAQQAKWTRFLVVVLWLGWYQEEPFLISGFFFKWKNEIASKFKSEKHVVVCVSRLLTQSQHVRVGILLALIYLISITNARWFWYVSQQQQRQRPSKQTKKDSQSPILDFRALQQVSKNVFYKGLYKSLIVYELV